MLTLIQATGSATGAHKLLTTYLYQPADICAKTIKSCVHTSTAPAERASTCLCPKAAKRGPDCPHFQQWRLTSLEMPAVQLNYAQKEGWLLEVSNTDPDCAVSPRVFRCVVPVACWVDLQRTIGENYWCLKRVNIFMARN